MSNSNWWKIQKEDKFWGQVLAGFLYSTLFAILVSFVFWIAGPEPGQKFWPFLRQIFEFKIALWIYLLVTLASLVMLRLISGNKKFGKQISTRMEYDTTTPIVTSNVKTTQPPANIFSMAESSVRSYIGRGSKNWDNVKQQPIGEAGNGSFEFENGYLSVKNLSDKGRYLVHIQEYYFSTEVKNYVPAYIYGALKRKFRVEYEHRSLANSTTIVVALINKQDNTWPDHNAVNSEPGEWTKAYVTFETLATVNFFVEIHSWVRGSTNSHFQIRNLTITEIAENPARDSFTKK